MPSPHCPFWRYLKHSYNWLTVVIQLFTDLIFKGIPVVFMFSVSSQPVPFAAEWTLQLHREDSLAHTILGTAEAPSKPAGCMSPGMAVWMHWGRCIKSSFLDSLSFMHFPEIFYKANMLEARGWKEPPGFIHSKPWESSSQPPRLTES